MPCKHLYYALLVTGCRWPSTGFTPWRWNARLDPEGFLEAHTFEAWDDDEYHLLCTRSLSQVPSRIFKRFEQFSKVGHWQAERLPTPQHTGRPMVAPESGPLSPPVNNDGQVSNTEAQGDHINASVEEEHETTYESSLEEQEEADERSTEEQAGEAIAETYNPEGVRPTRHRVAPARLRSGEYVMGNQPCP
eukprot:m.128012 g.128012  ORF g.128012 m.128012 type:complete len:191 (-) comp52282_c0_seq8:105-677(-)